MCVFKDRLKEKKEKRKIMHRHRKRRELEILEHGRMGGGERVNVFLSEWEEKCVEFVS